MANSLQVYTTIFIFQKTKVLFLKRAEWKKFAPNLYTGIVGKVEENEHKDIRSSAYRELQEETRIKPEQISPLKYAGEVLVFNRPDGDHLIYYYSSQVTNDFSLDLFCNEGKLEWHEQESYSELEIIPTTKSCLSYIVENKPFRGIYNALTEENKYLVVSGN